ncbi:choice-of-anchor A family protein [Methylobacillus caricis]|uniref:choice-of-anchor A family protein n=1 Tax=Methylobacillus caricis TaxID=1971611 RepID=UPI001CFF8613|nr:choice-of-anchor A family protein [Methylobacillus caricis]MCB5189040.1 choice-of-anchor A family protein [Methylobacillus caricis]
MLLRSFMLSAFAAAMLFNAGAEAALDANQTLNQFNAIVFGNINSSSHIDGRTWVGGNVNGGEYVGHPNDTPASGYAGLTVKGNANNIKVNGYGSAIGGNLSNSAMNKGSNVILGSVSNTNLNDGPAYVAGSDSGSNFNGGKLSSPNSLMQGYLDAVDSTNFYSVLSNTSSQLRQLDSTSSVIQNGNRATFSASADSTGLAVFNLTDIEAGSIFSLAEFDFTLNGASTVVINVALTDITISANFINGSAHQIGSSVIWNFYNATTVTLNNEFGGSVLALNADLTNNQNIEGGVFVKNLTQNGEIHLQPFTGNIITAVPEPSSYAMLLLGLGLIALTMRRRM